MSIHAKYHVPSYSGSLIIVIKQIYTTIEFELLRYCYLYLGLKKKRSALTTLLYIFKIFYYIILYFVYAVS
jgi:hypothetical protein